MPAEPSPDVTSPTGTGPAKADLGAGSTRRVGRLFAEYAESHRNPINLLIHWLAVPVIYWTVLALLSALPFPTGWRIIPGLDWGAVTAVVAVLYVLTLSIPLAVAMAAFSVTGLVLAAAYSRWGEVPLWQFALFVFVFAWILQLIGHKIEGRKPSFYRDQQFLLIGPLWLLAKLFRLFGLKY